MTFMIKVKCLRFENLKCSEWPICTCVKAKNVPSATVGPLFGRSYGLKNGVLKKNDFYKVPIFEFSLVPSAAGAKYSWHKVAILEFFFGAKCRWN